MDTGPWFSAHFTRIGDLRRQHASRSTQCHALGRVLDERRWYATYCFNNDLPLGIF